MKLCSAIARSIFSIIILMIGLLNLSAHANTTAFYGIDLGVGPAGAHPSSDAAKVNFLNALGSFAVGTETFEDNALGSFFGGTAALAFPS